jgi:hypothetical protein
MHGLLGRQRGPQAWRRLRSSADRGLGVQTASRPNRLPSFLFAGSRPTAAKVVLDYPTVSFADHMSLLKINGQWKIVSKSFHAVTK